MEHIRHPLISLSFDSPLSPHNRLFPQSLPLMKLGTRVQHRLLLRVADVGISGGNECREILAEERGSVAGDLILVRVYRERTGSWTFSRDLTPHS